MEQGGAILGRELFPCAPFSGQLTWRRKNNLFWEAQELEAPGGIQLRKKSVTGRDAQRQARLPSPGVSEAQAGQTLGSEG